MDEPTPAATTPQLLIVDDDPAVLDSLTLFFEQEGWNVHRAETGEEAIDHLDEHPDFDAVLLDIHLPGISGFDVLERAQERNVVAPILVISTNAEDDARLQALGLGAEDYLTKPFDPDELSNRLDQVAGFTVPEDPPANERPVGTAVVDFDRHVIRRGADEEPLSDTHIRLLNALLRHEGRPVSRKRLLKEGMDVDWDSVTFTFTLKALCENLDRDIAYLQRFIEHNPDKPKYLKKVFGQGYKLQA